MSHTFINWTIEKIFQPYPNKNHDAYNISSNAITVADGATPLDETFPTDISAFAADACIMINQELTTLYTPEAYQNTIENLKQKYSPAGYKRSAGIATAHINNNNLTFSTLGDVTCYIQTNKLITLRDDKLIKLDQTIPNNSPLTDYIENRSLLNTLNGYYIFADNIIATKHLTQLTLPLKTIQSFMIATDGAWRLFDNNPALFIKQAQETTLDATMKKYQKHIPLSDDATIILATK